VECSLLIIVSEVSYFKKHKVKEETIMEMKTIVVFVASFIFAFAFTLLFIYLRRIHGLKKRQEAEKVFVQTELESLKALVSRYYVEDFVDSCEADMENILKEKGLEDSIKDLAEIAGLIEKKLKNPDSCFKKKIHDPLDRSLLTDPVNLLIQHPTHGERMLRVNRHNWKKYRNEGPVAFPKRETNTVRTYTTIDRRGETIFVDSPDFNSLRDDDGRVVDEGFKAGGGEFGGGGANNKDGDSWPDPVGATQTEVTSGSDEVESETSTETSES
jgi:hypothetical protein